MIGRKSPAFQFYPKDWIVDTRTLTSQEKGIYIDLLAQCWIQGNLPNDLEMLSKLANEEIETFKKCWINLKKMFHKNKSKLYHKRLSAESHKQMQFSAKQSQNARKLWLPPSKPSHMPNKCQTDALQFSSSSSSSSSKSTDSTPPKSPLKGDCSQETSQTKSPEKPPADYKVTTPLQKVVAGWKMISGNDKEDRDWDKLNWGRTAKSAKKLLEYFNGDWEITVDCMEGVYEHLTKKQLTCTIETICKWASEWRNSNGKLDHKDRTED